MYAFVAVILTFGAVFGLFAWALCKAAAKGNTATAETLARINPEYDRGYLARKYACLDSTEELAAIAAEQWA